MSVAVSKAGPYYSSGEISFSSLRSNFRAQQRKQTSSGSETFSTDTAPIKASQLLRKTATTETNPIVPNAAENSNVSTSTNWKVSQFRNTIKYYYITQSGTDTNFDVDAQSWNTNLNKNIVKIAFIDGTCGSNSSSSAAVSLDATAFNLVIDNYGSILGASGRGGGTGGGAPDPSGENGGDGISISSSSGNNISVNVRTGSRLYAGGGGGERGKNGSNGSSGRCNEDCGWRNTFCQTNAPGQGNCPSGYNSAGARWVRCCQGSDRRCSAALWELTCCQPAYDVSGGVGGAGGPGGRGRGYDYQSGSRDGSAGSAGTSAGSGPRGSCGATSGTSGEVGGIGGDWGSSGTDTENSGNGGSSGRAVSGSNYSVTGTINSTTVKGLYNP